MSKKQLVLDRLAELGVSPKRSLGQNFLVGEQVISRILEAVKRLKPEALVEIGPGLGALTEPLIQLAVPFQVIELDRTFAEFWRTKNIEVHEADALKIDWGALRLVRPTVLVSNLPYQIGGHLVVDRSIEPFGITAMVLMFQKEVAQRMTALPSTEDYGFLSVVAQSFWTIQTVVDAGPGQFYPPPNVTSRVLKFERKTAFPEDAQDFVKFVKMAFMQRRKLLTKNLKGVLAQSSTSPEEWKEWLSLNDLSETVRAEELTVMQFQQLFQWIRKKSIASK